MRLPLLLCVSLTTAFGFPATAQTLAKSVISTGPLVLSLSMGSAELLSHSARLRSSFAGSPPTSVDTAALPFGYSDSLVSLSYESDLLGKTTTQFQDNAGQVGSFYFQALDVWQVSAPAGTSIRIAWDTTIFTAGSSVSSNFQNFAGLRFTAAGGPQDSHSQSRTYFSGAGTYEQLLEIDLPSWPDPIDGLLYVDTWVSMSTPPAIPETSTLPLLALGLATVLGRAGRSRNPVRCTGRSA